MRIDVLFSYQSNDMYTALQQMNAPGFWAAIIVFGVLATIYILQILVIFYIGQRQIINWRLWLNERMVDDWLQDTAYHRARLVAHPIDNPDQRIQEDIRSYASTSQSLGLGMVSSMVSLVSFSLILWGLSGP